MAKNEGWIKWYRKAEQNEILKDECFDKYHAFLYLVERANIEPIDIPFGQGTMHLDRGQFHTSIKKLAETWNWSEGKTRRFLGALTGAHMVGISSNTNGSTITIEKYSKYQNARRTKSSTNDNTDGSTSGRQRKNIKEREDEKSAHGSRKGAPGAGKKVIDPPLEEPDEFTW